MPPTIPPPAPARKPFAAQMTARNVVHLVLTIAVVGVLGALYAGVHPPAGLDAAQIQTACYALLVGLFIPGSPIGRVLDAYFPPPGQAASSPTLDDLTAAKNALVPPATPPQRIPPSREGGHAGIDVLLAVLSLAALAWAALRAWAPALLVSLGLAGCGASALRVSAISIHSAHEALADTGTSIEVVTSQALAACPREDGALRTACVDRIEHESTAAASLHDLLIAPVDVARAEVFAACSIDPAHPVIPSDCPDPPPDVQHRIDAAIGTVAHDWPAFVAAMVALGAPSTLTAISFPGGS